MASLAIAIPHLPGLGRQVFSYEGGPVAELPSLLDVTDSFSRNLDLAERATVLATVPVKALVTGRFWNGKADWIGWRTTGTASRRVPWASPTVPASAAGWPTRRATR